ncbi:DNA-binding protein [Amnibacterium flavum]|uniref:DNA-binding protein n=1 Tax=Amnibacterium flavum TaxID=2173173 RepID=A0A2V1HML6_9MICO|nr:DNA-binding protein [Amnibacterium flavum]
MDSRSCARRRSTSDRAVTSERPLLYTPAEAASLLRISRSKFYELLTAGEIRSVKIGQSRRVRRTDLEEYVERLTE